MEVGEAPIITEPVRGEISLALDHPEKAKVFVLDDLGNRGSEVKTRIRDGELVMKLPGDYHTRFFEIVVR